MKPVSLPSSPVRKALVLAALAAWCAYAGMALYQRHLQLGQAKRTLMLLKSISGWQRELLAAGKLTDSYAEAPALDFYTTHFYDSEDTFLRLAVKLPNAYVLATARPGGFDTVPYGLLSEEPADRAFCLAYQNSRAAKRFCGRLGADVSSPVYLDFPEADALAGYAAYALPRWKEVPPLVDEPVEKARAAQRAEN